MKPLSKTEEPIYHAILSVEAQREKLGRPLTDEEIRRVVKRAADEIKVYKPSELKEALEKL